jgi:hypothetical protein
MWGVFTDIRTEPSAIFLFKFDALQWANTFYAPLLRVKSPKVNWTVQEIEIQITSVKNEVE